MAVKPPLQHSQESKKQSGVFINKSTDKYLVKIEASTSSTKSRLAIAYFECTPCLKRCDPLSPGMDVMCSPSVLLSLLPTAAATFFAFIDSTSAAHLFHAYVISPLDKILLLRVGPFWSLSPALLTLSSHHFAESLNFSKIPHLHCSVALFKCFSILSVSQLHFPLLCLSRA